MEPCTIVPSTRTVSAERTGGDLAYFNGRRLKQRHDPVWRLEDEEEIDLTGFHGLVLDVSYNILPNLRGVAAAPSFARLTVVSLKETGIEDIQLLRCCAMLVHLDLSSNEIIDLVGDDFWACFPNLLVLLLHGNKVRRSFLCICFVAHDDLLNTDDCEAGFPQSGLSSYRRVNTLPLYLLYPLFRIWGIVIVLSPDFLPIELYIDKTTHYHLAFLAATALFDPQVKDWHTTVSLGLAPRLTYLTLFYNPVSKMKMYRTFTANYCESLRGLDRHAVSDEEVIESAKFSPRSRYRTCSAALALPQALFKGLTDTTVAPPQIKHEGSNATLSLPAYSDPLAKNYPSVGYALGDDEVFASVTRRVELLRTFHARHSPVIILQRQIRRFLKQRTISKAVVKIQAYARMWIVGWRATSQLKELLRETGELYLLKVPHQDSYSSWLAERVEEAMLRSFQLYATRDVDTNNTVSGLQRAEDEALNSVSVSVPRKLMPSMYKHQWHFTMRH